MQLAAMRMPGLMALVQARLEGSMPYIAGFAGVEDFDFYQSGALLALNTFGSFLVAGLALPLVCLPAPFQQGVGAGAQSALATTSSDKTHQSQAHPSAARHQQPPGEPGSGGPSAAWPHRAPADEPEAQFWCDLRVASVMFVTVMTLNAAVATASAAIQRRHLMVWALFAPKFLFDACILLVCDAAVLVGVGVALLVSRRPEPNRLSTV
jgi:GPI ethanolamine phosphate transferase 3 subunit O